MLVKPEPLKPLIHNQSSKAKNVWLSQVKNNNIFAAAAVVFVVFPAAVVAVAAAAAVNCCSYWCLNCFSVAASAVDETIAAVFC